MKGTSFEIPFGYRNFWVWYAHFIFVPYFLQTHSATGQSFTLTINLDTNQFHLQQHLSQNACIANPHFTNNFPILIVVSCFLFFTHFSFSFNRSTLHFCITWHVGFVILLCVSSIHF